MKDSVMKVQAIIENCIALIYTFYQILFIYCVNELVKN